MSAPNSTRPPLRSSIALACALLLLGCADRAVQSDAGPGDGGGRDVFETDAGCECLSWTFGTSCSCDEVFWGCKGAPQRWSVCDATGSCKGRTTDPITGCSMPKIICTDSCLGPPTCDKSLLGKVCTSKNNVGGGECGDPANTGLTCLLTDQISETESRGVCACQCTADDPKTPLVNEDSCPDLSAAVCGTVRLTDGTSMGFCFRRCGPKLGVSSCPGDVACDPRSSAELGLLEEPVCLLYGCKTGADCPVVTAKVCKTDGSVSCGVGESCLADRDDGVDGHCAKPGKCDTASGLCAPREADFKAGAKVGDPCKDDTECDKNMRCEREVDRSLTQKAGGESCSADGECCSGRCDKGSCAPGLCTVHARNGYCTIDNCAYKTLAAYQCPAGSSCNRLFAGGLCMKDCALEDPTSCRGHVGDKLGDYECRRWSNVTIGGETVTPGPVCDFGDTFRCDRFPQPDFRCANVGAGPTNATAMTCRDLQGRALADPKDPNGLCLDSSASGPP